MSKSGMKIVQIITAAVMAAALVGVYTMGGDKSFDERSGSLATPDTAAVDTADVVKESAHTEENAENYIEMDTDPETTSGKISDTLGKSSDIKASDSDKETEKDTDKENHSDIDSDSDSDKNFDTDKNSDKDSDTDKSTDEELDDPSGTIFPYRGVWNLIIVNKDNPIPEGYDFTLAQLDNGKKVDSRIYDDLLEMMNAMTAAGIYPVIGEAYRTAEEQEEIMQSYISGYIAQGYSEEGAKAEAEKWVAQPGTSEHQVGLALDINADTNYSSNETVYTWLAENAYKYGFILRYPQGKEDITGIDYEPWHYRYVGKIAAEEIYKSDDCLEEYLKE